MNSGVDLAIEIATMHTLSCHIGAFFANESSVDHALAAAKTVNTYRFINDGR